MEFVCPDPNATVRAANVKATLDAFALLPALGRRIVARHRLDVEDMRPDRWLPVQRWLDALRDVQREVGTGVVREVGARIVENADFPPAFADAEAVLLALDQIYHLNHRGEVGHYRVAREGDGTIVVRCETPYPRHFEWGLVDGICRNKRVGSQAYTVVFVDGPAGGDLTCTLKVRRTR